MTDMVGIPQSDIFDDYALISRIKENPNHFRLLVERYWDPLFRFVRRISSFSHEDIEDVLQETFIKAYRNINSFSGDYKFSTWLYQIARTKTIDAYRKTKARPQGVGLFDEEMSHIVSSNNDVDQRMDTQSDYAKVRAIVNELPAKYREVMVLRFIEEKSYDEIVDIVKKPRNTVASLLRRGKELIKQKLKTIP